MDILQLSDKALEHLKKKDVTKQELQEFCERQYAELIKVLGINKQLQEEITHLRKLVTSAVPIIKNPNDITSEELICLQQIEKLRQASMSDSLTMEECKKLSEYVKILRLVRGKDIDLSSFSKDFKTEDLLKIIDENGK